MKMGLFKSASANLAKRLEGISDERMHKIDRALACFSAGAWFGLWVHILNDDIQLRLSSIRRLSTIAGAPEEERTRRELIPFLSENNDDDDKVLLAMAEELGVFIPYVGGVEHAHVLLPTLENLCTVEETCVRDKAVESPCRIGSQIRESDLNDYFVPLVKSAPETLKTELRSIYSQLCQDDIPMVRRSAATNLGKFAATIGPAHLKTDIMSIFEDLTQDDQDSVRLLAVEGCAALGKLLEPQDCVAHILPVIVNFSQVFEKPTVGHLTESSPWTMLGDTSHENKLISKDITVIFVEI
ncbi:hypothetical protein OROGR_013242 [Orobanche gracilis]